MQGRPRQRIDQKKMAAQTCRLIALNRGSFLVATLGAVPSRPSGFAFDLIIISFAVKLLFSFASSASFAVRLSRSLAALASWR
jgi:hypothetical protein